MTISDFKRVLGRISGHGGLLVAALPACLIVLAVALFFAFLRPPAMSDQLGYFIAASDLSQTAPSHRDLRTGLIAPVWAAIQMFNYSELAYYLVPLLTFVAQILGIWLLARLTLSRATSFIACALYMLTPSILLEASHLLPDYTAAALLTFSFYCLALPYVRRREGRPLDPRSEVAFYAAAGLFMGWAYLAREYVVILFPVIGAMMLYYRAGWARWAAFCATALGCFVFELVWCQLLHGDPLARFSAVSSPRQTERVFSTDAWEIILQLFATVGVQSGPGMEVLFMLGLGALFVALVIAPRRYLYFAGWGVAAWLFFTLVALLPVLILDEDQVYLRMQKFRYWAMLLPPLYIGMALVLFETPKWLTARAVESAALAQPPGNER